MVKVKVVKLFTCFPYYFTIKEQQLWAYRKHIALAFYNPACKQQFYSVYGRKQEIFSIVVFFKTGSCYTDQTSSFSSQTSLDPAAILQYQPPKCSNYRYAPLCLI